MKNTVREIWLEYRSESVMVALFKTAYNPFQVGHELMESTPMLVACVFAWMLMIYPNISIRPGHFSGLRVEEAKRMKLEHPEWTIQEVALHCGFSSRQTFTRTFLRETGQTPSEWFSTQNKPR